MTEELAKIFVEKMDWKGLSEAYRESEIAWSANEWKNFIKHIRKEAEEEIKHLKKENEIMREMLLQCI